MEKRKTETLQEAVRVAVVEQKLDWHVKKRASETDGGIDRKEEKLKNAWKRNKTPDKQIHGAQWTEQCRQRSRVTCGWRDGDG